MTGTNLTKEKGMDSCVNEKSPAKVGDEGGVESNVPSNSGEQKEDCNDDYNDNNKNNGKRYLDTTSSKVLVQNVMKYMNKRDINKMTKSWEEALHHEVEIVKCKKPPKDNWIVCTLKEESMVPKLIDYINNSQLKNKRGYLIRAKTVLEQAEKRENIRNKRRNDAGDNDNNNKRQKADDEIRVISEDEVKDAALPLWRLSYAEQLRTKHKEMIRKCAMRVVQLTKAKFRHIQREAGRNKNRKHVDIYEWLNAKRAIEVQDILPVPNFSRNKCEFTFGYRYEIEQPSAKNTSIKVEGEEDSLDNALEYKKIPCVGMMARGWSGSVSRPHCCSNMPSEALAIVDTIDEFLASSKLLPYDSKQHTEFWRLCTVRLSRRTGHCMIVVVHAPPTTKYVANAKEDKAAELIFEEERKRFIDMLGGKELPTVVNDIDIEEELRKCDDTKENENENENNDKNYGINVTEIKKDSHPLVPVKVTSIFFQEFSGLSNPKPEHPVQHAYGDKFVQEILGRCKFQISPGAFFQVNTIGAEILYDVVVKRIRELHEKRRKEESESKILLLDVCCGTGTIGLTCMKEGVVDKVVGVDISQPAIEDAMVNAKLNGYDDATESKINNDTKDKSKSDVDGTEKDKNQEGRTKFVAGKAEDVLSRLIGEISESDYVIAVVDPARDGLHQDVCRLLRRSEFIDRIVYVSCNPTGSLVRDSQLLCQPPTKKYSGRPFRPSTGQPVDMFPYTNHCELVMTFDRLKELDM